MTAACVNGKLVACGSTVVDCGAVGCLEASATNATRCKLFTPTAPAKTSDLTSEVVTAALEIGATTTIDVTTGEITTEGVTVRGPTNGATWNADRGIGFEVRQVKPGRNAAVLVARDIVLTGAPTFSGTPAQSQAFVLVAQQSTRVAGQVNLPCGQVTGGEAISAGESAGQVLTQSVVFYPYYSGAGGAGGNSRGGSGANVSGYQTSLNGTQSTASVTGAAGGAVGTLDALRGGSGGGAGLSSNGGAGGAAFLLVAGTSIDIGAPGSVGAGFDASGCGGEASGGGGAGGWVGVEAPRVRVFGDAGIAANGGGGGGGGGLAAGARGSFSTTPAAGGAPGASQGSGGAGGTSAAPAPGPALVNPPNGPAFGGGGGGAAGRIVVRTATGAFDFDPSAATAPTPWFTSPTATLLGLVAEGD